MSQRSALFEPRVRLIHNRSQEEANARIVEKQSLAQQGRYIQQADVDVLSMSFLEHADTSSCHPLHVGVQHPVIVLLQTSVV